MRFIFGAPSALKHTAAETRAGSHSFSYRVASYVSAKAMMKVLIKKTVALFFIERRDLKIPATGNPCVLTAG
jgi:hypothetical protein